MSGSRTSRLLVLLALAPGPACQRVTFPDPGHDDGEWVPPPDEGEEKADDDGDGPPDLPPRLDLGEQGGTDTAGDGCHLVDLLFVIDDSASMAGEQANLVASFDGFITGMRDYLVDANDFHVGVVTTDAYAENPVPCRQLGALVTRTPAGTCGPYAGGDNFMTDADDLDQAFACAGQVGTAGDPYEKPIAASIAALGPELGAEGACNAGFVRDDALLVLVVITDEDDEVPGPIGSGSPGNPAQWFADLVALKGGESASIVMLALVGTNGIEIPNECPYPAMDQEGAEPATRILELVDMFDYGFVGDVCAASYDASFEQALSLIQKACLDFDPP